MKSIILIIILGLGWVFLALFLATGYYFNTLSNHSNNTFKLSPITWDNHMHMFNGAIQCNMFEEELIDRKETLRKTIFSKVQKRDESLNGITYYFKNDSNLLESVLEHVQIEKACCPFFKFDISILPFNNGFAFQVSGSEEAIEMIKDFEKSKN